MLHKRAGIEGGAGGERGEERREEGPHVHLEMVEEKRD